MSRKPFNRHQIKTITFVLFSVLIACSALSQQDFKQFKTLVSHGEIPTDFTTLTSEKIDSDFKNDRVIGTTTAQKKEFLEGIHGSIDQLLQSGSVIYGDEISLYVQSIAAILLKDEPELLNSLRFYTIKSNETNALSTDQGIVFVTTGLISQLSSEAQLAYVLSHEIAHFTEKHILDNYQWQRKSSYTRDRLEKLSSHSKEHELDADKIALKRYSAAGYSQDEIIATFDVLMYSYLPFDDITFPKTYFNTDNMYVPLRAFSKETYPIKSNEDYDDKRSSHPNIKKRKESVLAGLSDYTTWGNNVNILGTERFQYIREVSRFESLRTNLIDAEFSEALYSIFILEQSHSESTYLDEMKSLAWLGLVQLNENDDLSSQLPKSSTYEGEGAQLFYFIRKMSDQELLAVGLRTVYDIHKKYPENELISGVYDRMVRTLAEGKHFKLDKFSNKTFHETAELAIEKSKIVDTNTVVNSGEVSKSKYDKIKSKKDLTKVESFDSLNFSAYAIPDIISDSAFVWKYNSYKKSADSITEVKDAYAKLTKKEKYELERIQKKERFVEPGINLNTFIVVEPAISYSKKDLTALQSEKEHDKVSSTMLNAGLENDLSITMLNQQSVALDGTTSFNERNAYISFLEQASHYGDVKLFPVDYYLIKEMSSTHNTSIIMFTSIDYSFQPDINPLLIIVSAVIFPTLPLTVFGYLPAKLMSGPNTEINSIVFDAQKGELVTFESDVIHGKPKRAYLGAYYYQLFNNLKNAPKQ